MPSLLSLSCCYAWLIFEVQGFKDSKAITLAGLLSVPDPCRSGAEENLEVSQDGPWADPDQREFRKCHHCSSRGSLECRRCVVVGNGHRLRNSSLGSVINKYDVVIRYVVIPPASFWVLGVPDRGLAEGRASLVMHIVSLAQTEQCSCDWI